MTPIRIVPANAAHQNSIQGLLLEAFSPSTYEEVLVDELRKQGRELLEWVALDAFRVVGYLAYTRAYRDGSPMGFHLGPLAICPSRQRQGIASRLVLESMESPTLHDQTIFVLGEPAYYRRLGFSSIENPRHPFNQDKAHFLAKNLPADTDFEVAYEPEFKHS